MQMPEASRSLEFQQRLSRLTYETAAN
ncbi:hypothetical protein AERO9AM_20898 [Aeromicrobium sp. 9AM]|nr:hypothetical protein AERO9AM_20898 [Aeromicrobium sp. 9AM]